MSTDRDADERRARILALHAEDRARLAGLIRKQLDRIPAEMAKLREDQEALTAWLAEFAPELLYDRDRPVGHVHSDGCTHW